jgi:hypothetical protein
MFDSSLPSQVSLESRYPAFIANDNSDQRSRIRRSVIQGDQSSGEETEHCGLLDSA